MKCAREPIKKCQCEERVFPLPKTTHCCECGPKPSPPKCFPAAARTKLENGRSVSMLDLQIGDKVQTGKNTEHHSNQFFREYGKFTTHHKPITAHTIS